MTKLRWMKTTTTTTLRESRRLGQVPWIDLATFRSRFEEIHEEEPPKGLKRPRDDAMEIDEHEEKLSKSQKKKLAKKQKAADGKAVAPPTPEKRVEEEKIEKKGEEKKDKKKKDKAEKKDKSEQKDGEKKDKGDKKAERTLDGGVKVRDFKVGTGKMAKKGDKIEMRYIGKFPDGKVFDKCTKGKPVSSVSCLLNHPQRYLLVRLHTRTR